MYKIIIIAILGVVLVNTVKHIKGEYAVYLTLAVSTVMLSLILPEAKKLYLSISDLFSTITLPDKLFSDLTKICIVGYVSKIVCNICDDYGNKSVSDKVDMACRIYVSSVTISWIYKLLVDINKLL